MANELTSITFRVDAELKKNADALFRNLGLNMTTALTVFLQQSVREQRIPFNLAITEPRSTLPSASAEESNYLEVSPTDCPQSEGTKVFKPIYRHR